LFCAARVSRWDHLDPGDIRRFDPTSFSLNGLFLAQLAVGVLGVLVISSEYSTGQIRATFGAMPQRLVSLAAKVIVFTVVVFIVGLVACGAAFGFGQMIFQAKHAGASLHNPTVLRAVIGGALYLAVIGVFGIGLGTILRRTAGAIAALVGFVLILPILVSFLPSPWNDDISKFLPGQAGGAIFQVIPHDSNNLAPWAGFAVFCVYAVVSLVVGSVLLTRRDA
jgi:ABC-type transport system involved in multi-copper enzyme maturation permease subunit